MTDLASRRAIRATGGHHIITIAEEMARGLSPAFVITQASAHSAPTSGNEYKVVNWLRAGAILAQIDPVAKGYLTTDAAEFPFAGVATTGKDVNLVVAGQTNVLVEYTLHNLSDADFTYSGPAVDIDNVILAEIAPELATARRRRLLHELSESCDEFSFGGAADDFVFERGTDGVRQEVKKLKQLGVL